MSRTLLLVDDHPLFRRGVRELIIDHCEIFDRVLEAESGITALRKIESFSPDCVMLDVAMPEMDGLATLELIKQKHPAMRCIILTMYDKPEFVVEARKRGADGYILKTDSDAVILECLYSINEGIEFISNAVQAGVDIQLPEMQIEIGAIERLSKREREVLALIAKNCTSKEIASQLTLSLRTIQNHRVHICKKLNISGPNALLKIAIENQAWL